MTQETLSALLDGECSDRELDALLESLDCSLELKKSWSRLNLAREARAGLRVSRVDICAGVMAHLGAAPDAGRPKVTELVARRRSVSWRTAAGLAVAASVAAVAVALGVNFGSVHSGDALTATVTPDGPELSADIRTVAMTDSGTATRSPAYQMDDDLRNYMIEHSNTLADRGVGGALSYARFAAHTGDEAFAQPVSLTAGGTP